MVFLTGLKQAGQSEQKEDAAPPRLVVPDPVADNIDIEWVHIHGGTFSMGSEQGEPDEAPLRQVEVSSFQMAKTETTLAQYARCVDTGVCERPVPDTDMSNCNWGYHGREDRPLNCVTWQQAETQRGARGQPRLTMWGVPSRLAPVWTFSTR